MTLDGSICKSCHPLPGGMPQQEGIEKSTMGTLSKVDRASDTCLKALHEDIAKYEKEFRIYTSELVHEYRELDSATSKITNDLKKNHPGPLVDRHHEEIKELAKAAQKKQFISDARQLGRIYRDSYPLKHDKIISNLVKAKLCKFYSPGIIADLTPFIIVPPCSKTLHHYKVRQAGRLPKYDNIGGSARPRSSQQPLRSDPTRNPTKAEIAESLSIGEETLKATKLHIPFSANRPNYNAQFQQNNIDGNNTHSQEYYEKWDHLWNTHNLIRELVAADDTILIEKMEEGEPYKALVKKWELLSQTESIRTATEKSIDEKRERGIQKVDEVAKLIKKREFLFKKREEILSSAPSENRDPEKLAIETELEVIDRFIECFRSDVETLLCDIDLEEDNYDSLDTKVKTIEQEIENKSNEIKNVLAIQKILHSAELAEKYSLGNCAELASYAFKYLMENPNVKRIDMCHIDGGDHAFIIIGREEEFRLNHDIIIDPWAKKVYPASEYTLHMHDWSGTDLVTGEPIPTPIDPNTQTIGFGARFIRGQTEKLLVL